ncbi:MAG TPA: ABC transporter substrate-binding protein [Acidimicrobiales bacterium]
MFSNSRRVTATLAVSLLAVLVAPVLPSVVPAGAAVAASFPATVHAANGKVTIETRPTAIVSLSPTATEILYAIGAGSQVKAVDSYSDYPPNAPKTQLDGTNPNVEAIAAYKPDLVIMSDEAPSVDHQVGALGISVLSNPAAANLNQEYAQIDELGQATGHLAQAKAEVTKIKGQIAHIVASVPKPAHPVSYYYELDQTYYTATSDTFIGQVLGLLGLRSIADAAKGAAASGGYPQLNGEYILKSNPGYIFLADTLCCAQSPATVAARPGWSNLAAVKHGRVLGLNDDIASRWGPRIVILLQQVANELKAHPVSSS